MFFRMKMFHHGKGRKIPKPTTSPYERLRVEILQVNDSGLTVLLETKIFGLESATRRKIPILFKNHATFKWAYYQIGIYFCEIKL